MRISLTYKKKFVEFVDSGLDRNETTTLLKKLQDDEVLVKVSANDFDKREGVIYCDINNNVDNTSALLLLIY